MNTLFGVVKPDPAAPEFVGRINAIAAIADAMRAKLNPNPLDISGVMSGIGRLPTEPQPERRATQRHVRENMTEEELVVFDILTRPAPELSAAERDEVKKVARHLLIRLKDLLVLNWRQKSAALANVRLAIEDALDDGLPGSYTKTLFDQKCAALFEHVYESYPERDVSVYSQ